jgi:hypothetical protein
MPIARPQRGIRRTRVPVFARTILLRQSYPYELPRTSANRERSIQKKGTEKMKVTKMTPVMDTKGKRSGSDRGSLVADSTKGETTMNSPKRLARIAGLLYLIVGIFSGLALGYATPKVYVAGDAATTAGNILANSRLVRFGVMADLLQATVFILLALALYVLLKDVNKNASLAMVILVAIATTIMCLNEVFQFSALLVASDRSYAAAFGAVGSNALVMLLMDMHHYGFLIAQIFFGLWLAPLGYLAYTSGNFPKALGVVLIGGGICYLVDMVAAFLAPGLGAQIHGFLAILPTIAEVWMLGYLLVKGVKVPARDTLRQHSVAPAAEQAG